MKSKNFSWDALLVMSVVIVAGICSQSQQVALAQDKAEEKGRVVQISPDADAAEPLVEESVDAIPAFWIGLRGRGVQSAVLRTHLQLAEDMGVVIEEVIPESPADKAGLRKYDIILRANGEAVHGMQVLQQQVTENGDKPIELDLIRLGKEETLTVTPEQRPNRVTALNETPRAQQRRRFGGEGFGGGGRADMFRELLGQLQENGGLEGGLRMFGPGMMLGEGQQFGQNAIPDGVSLSVTRKNGEPARVTIQRGEETWELVEGDQEALANLPEDLRPMAENALQQGKGGLGAMQFNLEGGLQDLLSGGLNGFGGGAGLAAPPRERTNQEDELSRRLEQMEKDLRKLQEKLLEPGPVTTEELPAQ